MQTFTISCMYTTLMGIPQFNLPFISLGTTPTGHCSYKGEGWGGGGVGDGAIFNDSKKVGLLYSFLFQRSCYNLKEGE
jgi:hypothetical protein